MTDLSQLLEKVRTAEAGSLELDREIMCGPGGWVRLSPSQHPRGHKHPMFMDPSEGYSSFEGRSLFRNVPSVTTSLDAIVALIERELPGLVIKAAKIGDGSGHWQIQEAWVGDFEVVDDFSPMKARPGALAFTEVFLSALISKEKADG